MSTNGLISPDSAAQDLTEARAKLVEEVKVDILVGTQEADNQTARREVSRSFVCKFYHCDTISSSLSIPLK